MKTYTEIQERLTWFRKRLRELQPDGTATGYARIKNERLIVLVQIGILTWVLGETISE